ncbi:minor capsid protein [Gordonia sp. (in: high G+C Gram-positive bacteria)]|uniref:minor capsid protein n=1 Tax=Gordonia sp. (in: high G+C Gram-positive bacteria) TaxID=84139 RepID=UPI003C73ABF8
MAGPTVERVIDSLSQHLHDLGVATFTPDSVYPSTVTAPAVYVGHLYPSPDTAVSINHYFTDSDIATQRSSPRMRFQLRWRGDQNPRTVHKLADDAYALLHTLTPGSWPGGVRILWCVRQIVAPIEADETGRWERADSYEIQLNPITIGADNG